MQSVGGEREGDGSEMVVRSRERRESVAISNKKFLLFDVVGPNNTLSVSGLEFLHARIIALCSIFSWVIFEK